MVPWRSYVPITTEVHTDRTLAGVGKTILAYQISFSNQSHTRSIIVDYLEQTFLYDEDVAIACVYFNHKQDFTPVDVIRSILKHVVQRKTHLSEEIRALYSKHEKRDATPLTLAEATALLTSELHDLRRFYVVLDAMDESEESTRVKVLNELQRLPKLRLMATGRPYANEVGSVFKPCETLPICARDSDIEKFVRQQIDYSGTLKRRVGRDPELAKELVDTVVSKAQGL